jgi:hypothetical protein
VKEGLQMNQDWDIHLDSDYMCLLEVF